jgi:hypothetical protein
MTRCDPLDAVIVGRTARHLAATTYIWPKPSHHDVAAVIETLHTRAQMGAERHVRGARSSVGTPPEGRRAC